MRSVTCPRLKIELPIALVPWLLESREPTDKLVAVLQYAARITLQDDGDRFDRRVIDEQPLGDRLARSLGIERRHLGFQLRNVRVPASTPY